MMKVKSRMELTHIAQDFYLENSSFPYEDIIKDIVHKHIQAINIDIGRLDLCHLRTKQERDGE